MSELAFNVSGEAFEVPATAAGWKVKRMKAKGAPEVVYGRDGLPLVLPLDAGIDELRAEVDQPGRYRLDLVDENNRPLEGVPAGYVHVHVVAAAAPAPAERNAPAITPTSDATVEAMRLNTELARTVIERFPQMMEAAAGLLRAADGAGLPAREPRAIAADTIEDEDEDEPAQTSSPTFELINQLVAQIVPVIVTSLATKGMPKLGAVLDWRKAIPEATPATPAQPTAQSTPAATEHPPLDPATLAKVMAVQAQLTPAEASRARQLGAQLAPAELHAFFEHLAGLSVQEAVAKIRSLIGAAS
ncbi:MAG TPA: hypothetical protein VGL61_09585 [Kofleriaceae bacterium]|jgi:hypothetical protein